MVTLMVLVGKTGLGVTVKKGVNRPVSWTVTEFLIAVWLTAVLHPTSMNPRIAIRKMISPFIDPDYTQSSFRIFHTNCLLNLPSGKCCAKLYLKFDGTGKDVQSRPGGDRPGTNCPGA